jgi:hypothetical protein
MKRLALVFLFFASSFVEIHRAHAFVADANIFYFTDTTAETKTTSHKATLYDILVGFDLDKKGQYQAGWAYSGYTTATESNSQTTDYKATGMGPGFIFYLNKTATVRFGFSYLYKTIADYTPAGGTQENWRGTMMNANFGYQFRFEGAFSLGLRMNYSSGSFSEKVVSSTKTDVSNKKTIIYPSIALTVDSF